MVSPDTFGCRPWGGPIRETSASNLLCAGVNDPASTLTLARHPPVTRPLPGPHSARTRVWARTELEESPNPETMRREGRTMGTPKRVPSNSSLTRWSERTRGPSEEVTSRSIEATAPVWPAPPWGTPKTTLIPPGVATTSSPDPTMSAMAICPVPSSAPPTESDPSSGMSVALV